MGLRTFFGALRLAHHSEKVRKLGAKAADEAETVAEHAASRAEVWEKLADPSALAELLAEMLGTVAGEPARRTWEAAVAKRESGPQGFIAAGSEVFAVAADQPHEPQARQRPTKQGWFGRPRVRSRWRLPLSKRKRPWRPWNQGSKR